MAIWKKSLLLVLIALISAPALAQQGQQEAEQAAEQAYKMAQHKKNAR